MSVKILTVDDSKAVRIIVKKAFKSFACEIVEAANGADGLAAAASQSPDVILLDVTMPVMDGVELLTKLKADANLKKIPVIMLTAEAGRQAVMKIAKLGIRDYIVKPFKEDVLIDKVGRVIDLKAPGASAPAPRKSTDAVNLLVVDDKPAIIQQVRDGLAHKSWRVNGGATTSEAMEACQQDTPDVIILSLSLPEQAAFSIFRMLRADNKTKHTPIFALAVKTDTEAQEQAQSVGFSAIVTKPIQFGDLERRVAKAINLDMSERYFTFQEDTLLIHLDADADKTCLSEVDAYARGKISEAVDKGFYRIVFDLSALETADSPLVKLVARIKEICEELTLTLSLVASPALAEASKQYEEAVTWHFFASIDEAKEAPLAV